MNYITLRGSTYFFQRRVPQILSENPKYPEFFGKKLFQRSLQTPSRRLAKSKAASLNAEFEKVILNATNNELDVARIFSLAKQDLSESDALDARTLTLNEIESHFNFSFDREPNEALSLPKHIKNALEQLAQAESGKKVYSLREMALLCKEDLILEGNTNKKGILGKIEPAAHWLLNLMEVEDVDMLAIKPSKVKTAIRRSLNDLNLSASTINGHINALRKIWKVFVVQHDITAVSPFAEMRAKGKSNHWDRFFPEEITKMYHIADDQLKIAIKIGATTGARASEAVSMKVIECENSQNMFWSIKPDGDGKTANSTRIIPVHPKLISEIYPGFKLPISQRTLSRKFSNLIKDMAQREEFRSSQQSSESRKLSFHSFRSHVASELAFTGRFNPEEIGLYTGHKGQNSKLMRGALGIYIQTPSEDVLSAMAQSLCWPFD